MAKISVNISFLTNQKGEKIKLVIVNKCSVYLKSVEQFGVFLAMNTARIAAQVSSTVLARTMSPTSRRVE